MGKVNTLRKPVLIKNPQDPAEVGQECIRRLNALSDPAALILTVHLFTEHWLDQILLKFYPHLKVNNLTYAKKLSAVYSIQKIPKELFHNLKTLNELRNKSAHEVDFDVTTMKLNYHPTDSRFRLSEYKPSYDAIPEQHHISNVLGVVFADTYVWLHGICVKQLGFRKNVASKSQP